MAKKITIYRMQTWWSVEHNGQVHFEEYSTKDWSIQFPTYRVECKNGVPKVSVKYKLAPSEHFPKPERKPNKEDKKLTF
jgi:hypothetical protein